MRKPLLIVAGVLGTGLLVVSVLGVGIAYAGANPTSPLGTLEATIYQKVIDTLHLNVTPQVLATTIQDSRKQVLTDNTNTQIDAAVTSGKLTQTDADLAKKLVTEEQKLRDANTQSPTDLKTLTPADRILKIDQQRVNDQNQLLSDLGITQDQLTTLENKLRDAGIRVGIGIGGFNGGMMGGRGRAGMMSN